MAQVAFPDQDNKWLLSHLMRGLQCYPSAQELSTVLFLDFLPSLLPSIIGLKGSIFQGSIPRAGGHRTRGEIQQNGRDVHATLQVQPVSVLISHLFLSNWQSSISILNPKYFSLTATFYSCIKTPILPVELQQTRS